MQASISRRLDLKQTDRRRFRALSRYRHPLGMVLITAILAACFTSIKAGLDFAPPLLFGALRELSARPTAGPRRSAFA